MVGPIDMIVQRADVEAVLKLMPQVEVSLKLFVEEDDDSDNIYRGDIIVEKDIMTLRVNLTRNNVAGIFNLWHIVLVAFAHRGARLLIVWCSDFEQKARLHHQCMPHSSQFHSRRPGGSS